MGGRSGGYMSEREAQVLEELATKNLKVGNDAASDHIFISFANEDLDAVNLLRGQAKNEKSELVFDDYSLREPFDSENADYIKKGIRERIRLCSVTVVYLSKDSATSKWVDWEIRESLKMGKGVVGVYQGDSAPPKLPLAAVEAKCAVVPWRHKELMDAIDKAKKKR
jgi:hypothetical protein